MCASVHDHMSAYVAMYGNECVCVSLCVYLCEYMPCIFECVPMSLRVSVYVHECECDIVCLSICEHVNECVMLCGCLCV